MRNYLPNRTFFLVFSLAFCLSGFLGFSQGLVKQWDKTIGGNEGDWLTSLQQTTDGGFIAGGYSNSLVSGDKSQPPYPGNQDFWVVKTDNLGHKVWDKTIGSNGFDMLTVVRQTPDGGYILAGTSDSGVSGDKSVAVTGTPDFWIVKLDANGNKSWDKSFGGMNWEDLNALDVTSDGGFILGGSSSSGISGNKTDSNKGDFDYWVVRLDASGNKLWDKAIGGNLEDVLYAVKETQDGGFILGGYSNSAVSGNKSQASKGDRDYWVVKLDNTGNIIWDKTIGSASADYLFTLIQTADGGYVLGGHSGIGISADKTQPGSGGQDFWIVKLNSSGNKIWDKVLGGNDREDIRNMIETQDSNLVFSGWSASGISGDKSEASIAGSGDCWIVSTDAGGNKLWDKTIGGTDTENCYGLVQTQDGGFVLGATSGSGIGADKSEDSKGLTGTYDFWLVKLGFVINGAQKGYSDAQVTVLPNPGNGKFNLQLTQSGFPKATITVTDLLGRNIWQKEITITGNQLSEEINLPPVNGMYLLQIKAGNQTTTRKIIIK